MRSIAAPLIFLAMTAAIVPAFAQTPRAAADNSSAMAGRLDRLEGQLAALQSVVAAVETLAKTSGGGSGYQSTAGGGASAEQIRQLSAQVADLTQRLERLEARYGANTGPSSEPRREAGYNTVAPAAGFEEKEQLPPLSEPQLPAERYPARPAFNAPPQQQTANAGQSLSQPRLYGAEPAAPAPLPPHPSPAAAATTSSSSSRTLFEQATGALNSARILGGRDLFPAVSGPVSE